jgi:hypothetical protein
VKKLGLAVATLSLGLGSAFGATQEDASNKSQTTKKSFYQELKDSPLKMNIYTETIGSRADNTSFNGINNNIYPSLSYKISDRYKVAVSSKYKMNMVGDKASPDTWNRTTFKFNRTGILKQDKHGIDLSAGIDKRFYMQDASTASGHVRVSAKAKRKINNKLSVGASLYLAALQNKDEKTVAKTNTGYIDLVTFQSYSFNDKLSLSLLQEFYKTTKEDSTPADVKETAVIVVKAELGYQITPSFATAFGVTATPFEAADNRTFAKDWEQTPSVQVDFNWSVF